MTGGVVFPGEVVRVSGKAPALAPFCVGCGHIFVDRR